MRIVVLGASGGCGAHVVRHAVARGHAVTAVVRAGTSYVPPTGAAVVRGDVLDGGVLAGAISGHDAVLSCLGIRRRVPRNPWSRMLSPADFTSRAATAIVAAMRNIRIERVIAISAGGVGDSRPRMSRFLRWLFDHSRIGDAYRDLGIAESIFAASRLDWTCVRPVTLTPFRAKPAREVERYGLMSTIPRESVAIWMLDHLEGGGGRTPMIAA